MGHTHEVSLLTTHELPTEYHDFTDLRSDGTFPIVISLQGQELLLDMISCPGKDTIQVYYVFEAYISSKFII